MVRSHLRPGVSSAAKLAELQTELEDRLLQARSNFNLEIDVHCGANQYATNALLLWGRQDKALSALQRQQTKKQASEQAPQPKMSDGLAEGSGELKPSDSLSSQQLDQPKMSDGLAEGSGGGGGVVHNDDAVELSDENNFRLVIHPVANGNPLPACLLDANVLAPILGSWISRQRTFASSDLSSGRGHGGIFVARYQQVLLVVLVSTG